MRTPFRLKPSFNLCCYAEEATISDVGAGSQGADSVIAGQAESSTAVETSVAQSGSDGQVAGSVTATDGQQQTAPDVFEGIPSTEELQQQVEQRVPGAEGLLRLRTELERVRPDARAFEQFKPIVEQFKPETLQERLQVHESIFSPKLENGQPVLDERNLPLTTAHPFIDQMEQKRPGYAMDHLLDVLDYQTVVDPATGQKETLAAQFVKSVLGLDISRLEQYQNIDSLIAKSNGNVSSQELDTFFPLAGQTDQRAIQAIQANREAYKTLPSRVRQNWSEMDDEERGYELDRAKELVESRAFRQRIEAKDEADEEQRRRDFESEVQQSFVQDLATVRENAFTSLRDNLARVWQPSADDAINQDRYDDVLAPLVHLIDPDLQPMALKRLEREGIKVNAQEFNQNMSALVKARETTVRAKAYGDVLNADRAEMDFNRLQTQMMAKFNSIVLARAEKYGYQAKQIAQRNGELLTTASAVRPTVPGSGQVGQSDVRIDPRSDQAVMRDWNLSRQSA